jgi:hypothetical protein
MLYTRTRTCAQFTQQMKADRRYKVKPSSFSSLFANPTKQTSKMECLIKEHKIKSCKGFSFDMKPVLEEPTSTGITGSRQYFSKVIQEVISLESRRHCCDIRNTPTIANHKPDYLMREQNSNGEVSIVVVGEIKGMAVSEDSEFTEAHVGQILEFLKELLIVQSCRHFAYGFLTDGIRFQFFKANRQVSTGLIYFESSSLCSKAVGWTNLNTLLNQSNEALGFVPICIPGYDIGKWLGSGSSASVFQVVSASSSSSSSSSSDQSCVCKLIARVHATFIENEVRALTMMEKDPNTPTLVKEVVLADESVVCLVMSPCGEKLGMYHQTLPIVEYAALVDTIERAHKLELCHNDICPQNMFAVKNQLLGTYGVLLNDWGSSLLLSELSENDQVHTHPLYYDSYNMGPGQDLAALVRSVFMLTQQTVSTLSKVVSTATGLDELIRSNKQWPCWHEALDSAFKCEYANVKLILETGCGVCTPVRVRGVKRRPSILPHGMELRLGKRV